MRVVKTSTKGQVVIPAGLRAQIGLRPGAKVVVRLTGDGAVQIRLVPRNPVASGFGLFGDGPSLTRASKRSARPSVSAKRRSLLDSWAVLAYVQGGPAGARVRALMEDAERSGVPLLLNEVNAGEVFYMRAKTRSAADAEHFLDLLPTWPIQLVHNSR